MIIPLKINAKYRFLFSRKEIQETFPTILEADYEIGFKDRFFAKKLNNRRIIEIDKETYDGLTSKNSQYPYELYKTVKIVWKLTGQLKDSEQTTIRGKKIIYGVADTNERSVNKANEILPGIDKKLFDFVKYARLTENPTKKEASDAPTTQQ